MNKTITLQENYNMKKYILLLSSSALLSGCITSGSEFPKIKTPQFWKNQTNVEIPVIKTALLKNWWFKFEDPTLNKLVDLSLSDSPDRLIAKARIEEARGLRRSTRSSLFPQIGASASEGRQNNTGDGSDNYHDARFDASYEIDIFGKNRKASKAADAKLNALKAQYHDITLTLIAEVTRSYIDYRAFQKQTAIAEKNLDIQIKTLELIRQQRQFGEAPQLDVERAENLVNTTKASIPEFQRLANNAKLQLTVLTGKLPNTLSPIVEKKADIPIGSIKPVLAAPAQVLTSRPDILAANETLLENTALAESVTAELFPTFSVSGFFGIAENTLTSSTSIWNIAIGTAVSILDFGRIEGRIDAARARETQAFQSYRRTILAAVSEVETALTDTTHIDEQRNSLKKAYDNAEKALHLSEALYKEGQISFLDLLDAQRTVNDADTNLVDIESKYSKSLVRLYKSLGIY